MLSKLSLLFLNILGQKPLWRHEGDLQLSASFSWKKWNERKTCRRCLKKIFATLRIGSKLCFFGEIFLDGKILHTNNLNTKEICKIFVFFIKKLWLGKKQWRHEEGCLQLELLFVVSKATYWEQNKQKDIFKRDVYKLLELNWGWVFFFFFFFFVPLSSNDLIQMNFCHFLNQKNWQFFWKTSVVLGY